MSGRVVLVGCRRPDGRACAAGRCIVGRCRPGHSSADGDAVHDELVASVTWEQGRVFRYERWIDEPRLSSWQSGDRRHPALAEVEHWISRRYRVRFDGVALAHYRNERDSVAFHRDRELRWLDDTVIGVLSLGARRPWLVKPLGRRDLDDDTAGAIDLSPASGDLLVMGGRCQAGVAARRPQGSRPGPQPGVGAVAVDLEAGPARSQPVVLRAAALQSLTARHDVRRSARRPGDRRQHLAEGIEAVPADERVDVRGVRPPCRPPAARTARSACAG